MEASKILSADLLDLIFDNRNKDYGAYELRKHYYSRVIRAIVFTTLFLLTVFTSLVMGNHFKPPDKKKFQIHEVVLQRIEPDKQDPDPLPKPIPKPEPTHTQTVQHTRYVITDDDKVDQPPPSQIEIVTARIDVITTAGVVDDGNIPIEKFDEGRGIFEDHYKSKSDEPLWNVQVEAKYDGNWSKFLERNLNAEVPINNGAPSGSYTVIIQFVVDVDGRISDIKPLTNHGYGLEQEASRVIQKATKWEPAFQNGIQVKAYRKQLITFRVEQD